MNHSMETLYKRRGKGFIIIYERTLYKGRISLPPFHKVLLERRGFMKELYIKQVVENP